MLPAQKESFRMTLCEPVTICNKNDYGESKHLRKCFFPLATIFPLPVLTSDQAIIAYHLLSTILT